MQDQAAFFTTSRTFNPARAAMLISASTLFDMRDYFFHAYKAELDRLRAIRFPALEME
ncbi:MAG TPA: hypothetical protein VE756_03570 [Burkholderiales bacterium]|nr:hypothetical protein [Burkholderiales bacterium]